MEEAKGNKIIIGSKSSIEGAKMKIRVGMVMEAIKIPIPIHFLSTCLSFLTIYAPGNNSVIDEPRYMRNMGPERTAPFPPITTNGGSALAYSPYPPNTSPNRPRRIRM